MKTLSILGSTGSIGKNTLDIVSRFPDKFSVAALSAKTNIAGLEKQIRAFSPEVAVLYDADSARKLSKRLPDDNRTEILHGNDGYHAAATLSGVDMVVTAMVGAAGIRPTLAAIDAGKDIALANKETLVAAGEIVMTAARENSTKIFPVDSEHSAIFQCLLGNRRRDLDKILLTASGGPFRRLPREDFSRIRLKDALAHPNWQMGAKITIDSATMMNKGLEVIEAKWLFDVSMDDIEVIVHPQSIVHSMVAYRDGSVMAQMGIPDMREAIAFALSCPERIGPVLPMPDFTALGSLTFEKPDLDRFPCLALAFEAGKEAGALPAVMNAANETAVQAFLDERIGFTDIADVVRSAMDAHVPETRPDLEQIFAADEKARQNAEKTVENI